VLKTIDKATVIPSPAIQTGRDGKYVFVILADQSVEMRMVQVGFKSGEDVVIEKGIQPGERVVTDGQMQLATGRKTEERPAAGSR
jgi:multidrug efflux system membrane fusion protein